MSAATVLAWVVLPYLSIVLLIGGLVWRFRTDQFGWTSRSSQWRESAILRWSSPLFHLGILLVALGHVLGLVVPQSATDAMGIPHHVYHLVATIPGSIAGAAAVVGLVGLLYRRIVVRSVRLNTSRGDILTYALLTIPIALGAAATVSTQLGIGFLHFGTTGLIVSTLLGQLAASFTMWLKKVIKRPMSSLA